MRAEYLVFDLLVGGPVLALALWRRSGFAQHIRATAAAVSLAAAPFVGWDILVAGDHWWFNPSYTLGITIAGLPVEEWGFFLVVPFACVFAWETLLYRPYPPKRHPIALGLAVVGAGIGLAIAISGPAYTGLVITAAASFLALDYAAGTGLVSDRRFWLCIAMVSGLTLVFDGYLTSRPVVHYSSVARTGLQLFTVPLEDFAYSLALVGTSIVYFQLLRGRAELPAWLAKTIARRLGGYRHQIADVDARLPAKLPAGRARRVAVIGSGIAGLTAAHELAARGFAVDVLEKTEHIGGKIGAWNDRLSDGSHARVEHGFHAFFGHYYNLRAFLRRVGADGALHPIDDYAILTRSGERLSFANTSTVPLVNIVSLGIQGLYRWRDVARAQTRQRLESILRYDPETSFANWDDVSFERWADEAELPPTLRLLFTTFARAFFAAEDRVSMAEVIKSFHFYYLSHDQGLGYDYVRGDYETDLLGPIRDHLDQQNVRLRTGRAVSRIELSDESVTVDGDAFDYAVLATDVAAAGRIAAASPDVARRCPTLADQLGKTHAGQRYAVLRIWLDKRDAGDLPVFVMTERIRVLDSITYLHRIDPAMANEAAVLELHCYAVPDNIRSDSAIAEHMVEELLQFRPALVGATVRKHHLQVRSDFTAFHTGLGEARPATATEHPRLLLAGDWVKLPCPAMLMEAACTSGLLAANAIFSGETLRHSPVESVPLRGILAD